MLQLVAVRVARVEELPSILGVFGCQQQLGRCDAMQSQRFLVSMHELHLPGGGGRLQIFEPRTSFVYAEYCTADGNGAGRYDQDLVTTALQRRNILGQSFEPASVNVAISTDQERRAYFDDQAAIFGKCKTGHRSSR